MGAVSHGEIGLVVPGDRLLAAEDKTGLDSFLTNVIGEDLIHADAAAQHCALHERHARKDVPGLSGMNSYANRGFVEETVDDIELLPEWAKRRQDRSQIHFSVGAGRPPMLRVDAVADKDRGKAFRKSAGFGGWRGTAPDRDRFEPGQGHRDAGSAQEG